MDKASTSRDILCDEDISNILDDLSSSDEEIELTAPSNLDVPNSDDEIGLDLDIVNEEVDLDDVAQLNADRPTRRRKKTMKTKIINKQIIFFQNLIIFNILSYLVIKHQIHL